MADTQKFVICYLWKNCCKMLIHHHLNIVDWLNRVNKPLVIKQIRLNWGLPVAHF